MMGAPTVLLEKIPSGLEPIRALGELESHLGRKATATMPTEVGGINSTIPLVVLSTSVSVMSAPPTGSA